MGVGAQSSGGPNQKFSRGYYKMKRLTDEEIRIMLAQAFVICPICGLSDTLVAKPAGMEDYYCGYCEDCLDVCDLVGLGETEEDAILDYVEKNMRG
jgi:hypothetical protein